MADFSDSDNEKAVEELLSQAMDQSVLEQVAAIHCSGFTYSLLPTQLETRFRKLKSLPTAPTNPMPSCVTRSFSSSEFPNKHDDNNEGSPIEEKDSEVNLEDRFVEKQTKSEVCNDGIKSKSWNLEDGFVENDVFLKTPDVKRGKRSKSSSDSWSSRKGCVSPPVKTGCFWCSPKMGFSKKGKENRGVGKDDDDFFSDLSTFSPKNQEKLMKKAMEEQEKIKRDVNICLVLNLLSNCCGFTLADL